MLRGAGSSRPSAGGEYQFLKEAYGPKVSLLFALGALQRHSNQGAIAAVAFVLGDYANVLLNLGQYGPAIYAVIGVLIVTGINFAGTLQGKNTQLVLSLLTVAAVLVVAVAGFWRQRVRRRRRGGTWPGTFGPRRWCSCS